MTKQCLHYQQLALTLDVLQIGSRQKENLNVPAMEAVSA
ncbi:uncharacterized protein METZ01_LOCUS164442 [marine metagenome]|uniref:Uncharacterized protein n=1 Tax=marine metagenome TaxID=408172 RepID=A0A382BCU1_9ZZZZ